MKKETNYADLPFLKAIIQFISDEIKRRTTYKSRFRWKVGIGIGVITTIIVGVMIYVTYDPEIPYNEMNKNLEDLDSFIERNENYLETIVNYADNPNETDRLYIEYRYPDVSNSWQKVKKGVRGGQNKNIFGEKSLSDEYYYYMNDNEREILRNMYDYIEEVLKLPKEYNNNNPRDLQKVVESIENNSHDSIEKTKIIIVKYHVKSADELPQ